MPMYRHGNGFMHIKFSGKAKKNPPPPCQEILVREESNQRYRCCAMSTMLCDWPIEDGTCSKPLCPDHGREIGPDRHLCAAHMTLWLSRSPEQQRDLFERR